jgi:hypothetical protein
MRREGGTVRGEAYRVWLLQVVGFPVAGDSALSEEKECYSEYRIAMIIAELFPVPV